jgi:hypothetical protein
MRFPPTGTPLPIGPSAITSHPVGDVLIAPMPAVPSDASPDIAEAWSRNDLTTHFDAVVFGGREAVRPGRRLFQTIPREVGVAPWQALSCGDGGGAEPTGRMP